MVAPFPQRPKGMWWRTYERLCTEAFEAELLADTAFEIRAGRLLSRLENPRRSLNRKRSFWS
jgi:hypothetical protein